MKPVIEASNISKSYKISHQTEMKANYSTIKDDFTGLIKKPFGGRSEDNFETFWALKDITFEVNQGEIFGIVGQNGSGKSTLLKILSRIVEPTSGNIKMTGRVASLLEVGTGFHPELTGRENIFFNGSMLGMGRQEIKKKFNDIVDFSEVEKFLDTPVKFYSSGMYVRLAFSIAAHLEPEILILDEVLAVGDAAFQKKSLNKIVATMEEGATVLFVSHSIDTVTSLCSRGLFLKKGKIKAIGPIGDVASAYTGSMPTLASNNKQLEGVHILSAGTKNQKNISTDSAFEAELKFQTDRELPDCYVNLHIEDSKGQVIVHSRTDFVGKNPSFKKGTYDVIANLPRLSLNPGTYSVWFRIYSKHKEIIYMVDSERVMIDVTGKRTDSMATLDIPSSWHWSEVKNK
jgi:lipopolysaccharide transport system ATP-binding protein